jgi:hypothetical protein
VASKSFETFFEPATTFGAQSDESNVWRSQKSRLGFSSEQKNAFKRKYSWRRNGRQQWDALFSRESEHKVEESVGRESGKA